MSTRDLARAAWASSLGSALKYYDFALYSLASALVFSPLFFPGSNPATGLILSFGTYFLGFAVRPLGGVIFGRLGDRLGRKFVLLATILLMGGASTLIGVLPTYNGSAGDWYGTGAGIFAPVLLIVLRLMQGLGAGAEMAGASILMTEYAPARSRGLVAALPFLGVQMGTVAAALVYFLLLNTNQAVKITETWLWRVPFLASILILGVAIYIRLRLKESPTFARLEPHEQVIEKPLRTLLRRSGKTLLVGIGLRMAENGGSSIYQALAVAYVSSAAIGIKGPIGALSLVFAAAVGAAVVPLAGADRQHEIVASMIERQVDGLLVLPALGTDPERLAKQVNAANVPVVLLARRFSGFDYVGSENVKGARMLGDHLAALGARTVALLGGRPAPSLAEREEGLRASLEPKGVEVWSGEDLRSTVSPEGGAAALGRLLDQGRLPDAVVAYSDILAQGVYDEMRRRGLEPGRDTAVASFDDTRIAAGQVPPMTAVAGFPGQVGVKGAELLMTRLADGNADIPAQLALIEPKLKIRSSTAIWRPRT